jgi:predicted nucleic acid-binding protein
VAPALLPFEVASVCLKKIKRHPEMRGRLLEAYALRTHAGIDEVEVTLDQVIGLAEQNDLTCYDASYLWLALQLEAELVTLDEKLAGVAERLLP